MKKISLLFMMLLLTCMSALGQETGIDGVGYRILSEEEKTAECFTTAHGIQDMVVRPTVTIDGQEYTVTAIADDAVRLLWAQYLTHLTLPPTLKRIGARNFMDCPLTELELPSSLEYVGYSSLVGLPLQSLFIPASLTYIGLLAFSGSASTAITVDERNPVYDSRDNCNAIIETATDKLILGCPTTTIPPTVKIIGECSLGGLFADVDLPPSVVEVEKQAFISAHPVLRSITFHSQVPPVTHGDIIDSRFFQYVTLYVPEGSADAYKSAPDWGNFRIVEIPNTEPQDDYHPFVKEGKKWICSESVRTNETVGGVYAMYNQTTQYTLRINGDTIIGGTTYKKVYKEGVTVDKQLLYTYPSEAMERMEKNVHHEEATTTLNPEFLREADKKVYARLIMKEYGIDKEYVLYDFSVAAGEKVSSEFPLTNTFISSIDTIEVKGRYFRRYRLGPGNGGYEPLWVEGVGHPGGPFVSARAVTNDGRSYKLLSCYEDGECIFTNEDFNAQTFTKPADNMAYRPFVEEGKVWTVGSTTGISDGIVKMVDDYYFDGDTIIDGKTCKQMWCQRYVSPDHPDYAVISQYPLLRNVGAWYEENQKVYYYDEGQRSMRMMYDFSLGDYDILQFLNKDGYPPLMIGPKQTGGIKGFKGVYRDIMISTDLGTTIYSTTWLEGVGCIDGPTMNAYYYEKESRETFLMSCVVGDEVIYLNDEYEDGATPEEARKKRFDFTHTIKIQPKTPRRSEQAQSLYGEYNDVKLGINLNPLDDAYLVHITNESGQVVYEKTVNAGNIVALSIDISAYAKGRYIVTVENSSESFTGEFEVQTTGISDAVRLNDKGKMIKLIYNLHGQRLSSLQKGLNIVNGQKIYVK